MDGSSLQFSVNLYAYNESPNRTVNVYDDR